MATTFMHQLMTLGVIFVLLNAVTANSECPIKCDENKEYIACGSACPTNCSHHDVPPACTKQCAPGCFCMKDYLPNESGVCVLKKLCESCKGNTVYSGCATVCPTTCDNMFDNGKRICHAMCKAGCACKPGYVLNGEECVLPKDCPCRKPEQ